MRNGQSLDNCKFPAALANGKSPLDIFLTKYLSRLRPIGPGQRGNGGLWPAPRPFNTDTSLPRRPRGGHAKDRWHQKRSAHIWVNFLCGIHSALDIGLNDLERCSWEISTGLPSLQRAIAAGFLHDVLPMCRVAGVQLSGGRVGVDKILAGSKDEYRLGVGALSLGGSEDFAPTLAKVQSTLLDLPEKGAIIPAQR